MTRSEKEGTITFKKLLLFFLVFFCLGFLYFFRNLQFQNPQDLVFLYNDFLASFYPSYLTIIERFKTGDFVPLWDASQYLGMPLLARIDLAYFYPFNFVFFLIAGILDLSWKKIYVLILIKGLIHLGLAGVFTYIFCKKVLNLGDFEAFFSGLIYGFSGVIIWFMSSIGVMESLVWYPLLLTVLNRLLAKPDIRGSALFGLIFALNVLAGYPYSIIYNFIALVAFFSYKILTSSPKEKILKIIAHIGLGVVIGIGLSSVQLIPFLELAKLSYRGSAFKFDVNAFSNNLPPASLINYMIPFFFQRVGENITHVSLRFSNYMGISAVVLMIFAFLNKKYKMISIYFSMFLIFALLMPLGGETFLHPLLHIAVPYYGRLRSMYASSYLVSLSVAALGGIGLNFILEKNAKESQKILKFLRIAFFGLLTLLFYQFFRFNSFETESNTKWFSITNVFTIFIIFFGLSIGLIEIYLKGRISKSFFKIALSFLTVLDLFSAGRFISQNNSNIEPYKFYNRSNELIKMLRTDNSLHRVNLDELSFHYNTAPLKIDQVGGYQSLAPDVISSKLIPFIVNKDSSYKLQRLMNVKYLVTTGSKSNSQLELIKEITPSSQDSKEYWTVKGESWSSLNPGEKLYLYKLNPQERFYLSSDVLTAKNSEETLEKLLSADSLDVAVLPDQSNVYSGEIEEGETTQIEEYNQGFAKLRVSAKNRRILLFSENFYPGWKAYLNGKEQKITTVNLFMMGLEVPKGESEIIFNYEPNSFKLGAIISALTLLSTASIFIFKVGNANKNK